MPFVYRLQKILKHRENQREEQRIQVQKAQQAVNIAVQNIEKNNQEILKKKKNMVKSNPMMYEFYDKYLKHLWEEAERLEQIRIELQQKLDIEIEKLVKCEQAVKVLEKHKEKNKEIYIEEEKKAELKQFSDIGVTRFFRQKSEREEEELKDTQNNTEG